MENDEYGILLDATPPRRPKRDYLLPVSVFLSALVIAGAWIYTANVRTDDDAFTQATDVRTLTPEEKVLPPNGVVLPARWDDLGVQLTRTGVIDRQKFNALYASRGGMSEKERALLEGTDNKNLVITPENADFLLNLLWALGLGTKNDILEEGPLQNPLYGGASRFASTGGWTIAEGDPMNHYSRHPFFVLTQAQQTTVERVSKNIYRPCCNNSTHLPDCNHGMAMLGLLELMASQGVSEEEMYKAALQVNAYWFPDTYLAILQYLNQNGVQWEDADPKELLGAQYSSGTGYREILSNIAEPTAPSSGSCGV